MFETFNVPGLYIGVQAVLALYAGFAAASKPGKVGSLLPVHCARSIMIHSAMVAQSLPFILLPLLDCHAGCC